MEQHFGMDARTPSAGRLRRRHSRRVKRRSTLLETDYPQAEALTNEEFKDDQAGQVDQLLS